MAPVVVKGILDVDFNVLRHSLWQTDRDPGWVWWAQRRPNSNMVQPWLAGPYRVFFMCAFSLGQSVAQSIMKVTASRKANWALGLLWSSLCDNLDGSFLWRLCEWLSSHFVSSLSSLALFCSYQVNGEACVDFTDCTGKLCSSRGVSYSRNFVSFPSNCVI